MAKPEPLSGAQHFTPVSVPGDWGFQPRTPGLQASRTPWRQPLDQSGSAIRGELSVSVIKVGLMWNAGVAKWECGYNCFGKSHPDTKFCWFRWLPIWIFPYLWGSPNSPWVSIPVVMVIHDVHLVMTNSLPWNIHPFLRTVNHLFLWAIEIPWLC